LKLQFRRKAISCCNISPVQLQQSQLMRSITGKQSAVWNTHAFIFSHLL